MQPSQPTSRFLFAYGTLMSTASGQLGRPQRARLWGEATSLGPATTQGRLYDLGRYPGLVLSNDGPAIVHGEAFELVEPSVSLRWLDAYEGITASNAASAEYVRLERPVDLADRRAITAYTYVYRGDISTAVLIADGRWFNRSA